MQAWFCDDLGRCALPVQRQAKGKHGAEMLKMKDMRKGIGFKALQINMSFGNFISAFLYLFGFCLKSFTESY